MKLTIDQLRAAALGASYVEEKNEGVVFHRFTPRQEELYEEMKRDIAPRTKFPAGVKLSFRTDAAVLSMKVRITPRIARRYFAFEVFSNGQKVGEIVNFDTRDLPRNYTQYPFDCGEFSDSFSLGEGEKEICIHFPWSVEAELLDCSLSDGASFTPLRPKKRLLCFGDSITHGYDSLHPSCRYVCQLADYLQAEEHNKAIGAEIFFPELALLSAEEGTPDYISVAYGTNDWHHCGREVLERNSRAFFQHLADCYPSTELFVITPIWRGDWKESGEDNDFSQVAEIIGKAAAVHPKAHVICGLDLVPHDSSFYADLVLHPDDNGFLHYGKNLIAKIAALGF